MGGGRHNACRCRPPPCDRAVLLARKRSERRGEARRARAAVAGESGGARSPLLPPPRLCPPVLRAWAANTQRSNGERMRGGGVCGEAEADQRSKPPPPRPPRDGGSATRSLPLFPALPLSPPSPSPPVFSLLFLDIQREQREGARPPNRGRARLFRRGGSRIRGRRKHAAHTHSRPPSLLACLVWSLSQPAPPSAHRAGAGGGGGGVGGFRGVNTALGNKVGWGAGVSPRRARLCPLIII